MPLRALFPRTVRVRLLLAFSTLAVAAMVLAVVGWRALSNTQSALQGFDERVLPDISRSLELAERTANLAALAPYVSEANVPFQVQAESEAFRQRVQKVLALAGRIPDLTDAAPRLPGLLERLNKTLTELVGLIQRDLYLREDIRQHLYRLGQLRRRLDAEPEGSRADTVMRPVMDALLAASSADGSEALAHFRDTFDRGVDRIPENAFGLPARFPRALTDMGTGTGGIFALRRQQLELQQRKGFLLAQTRAISEQLSAAVRTYVDGLHRRVADQAESVGGAVRSGRTGIVAITVVCALAALLGITLVRGLVGNLKAVTHLMTRLAEGDTARATPATGRRDELGALARAFHVFRGNAVALKEQTRLLNMVFNNINDGLSVFDAHGRLVTWNPQYLQILELPAERMRPGMTLAQVQELLPAAARDTFSVGGSELNTSEVNQRRPRQPQAFERHFRNGKVVEFRSRPMPDGGFVTLYSDLTDRKAVEAQLRQSQKMEVLGQLTGGVAHDFNNLLGAAIGNLQLLEERPELSQRSRRNVERALAASERGASLTRRLLAFARRQQLTPEPTDVDDLIRGLVDLVEYSVDSSVRIRIETDSAGRRVHVDRSQLENALLNLAINASAAMPDGGELVLRTGFAERTPWEGAPAGSVVIEVADTGCGIPESLIERVFEPFFTTKEGGRGSGLGLSIVYGFIKQSGGDVRITSAEGRGTTVAIALPLDRDGPESRPAPEAARADVDGGPSRRVLL
ncbi:MAG: PAS-domain containing protein, partial [Ectothiorhodospiraceae bacterium]